MLSSLTWRVLGVCGVLVTFTGVMAIMNYLLIYFSTSVSCIYLFMHPPTFSPPTYFQCAYPSVCQLDVFLDHDAAGLDVVFHGSNRTPCSSSSCCCCWSFHVPSLFLYQVAEHVCMNLLRNCKKGRNDMRRRGLCSTCC